MMRIIEVVEGTCFSIIFLFLVQYISLNLGDKFSNETA